MFFEPTVDYFFLAGYDGYDPSISDRQSDMIPFHQ